MRKLQHSIVIWLFTIILTILQAHTGYCEDKPSELLKAKFSSAKTIVLNCTKDAASGYYRSTAEQILTAIGYQVVGKEAKAFDAKVEIEAEELLWYEQFMSLDGTDVGSSLIGAETKGKIKIEVPKSGKWSLKFNGKSELPTKVENPSDDLIAEQKKLAYWAQGSFPTTFLSMLATLCGSEKIISLLKGVFFNTYDNQNLRTSIVMALSSLSGKSVSEFLKELYATEQDESIKKIISELMQPAEIPSGPK